MSDCRHACEYIERACWRSSQQPPSDVRSHLDSCEPCRRLWSFASERETLDLCPDLERRIRESFAPEFEPVRPLPCRRSLALTFLGVFALVSICWIGFLGAPGAAGMNVVQLAGVLVAIAAGAAIASVKLGSEMIPGTARPSRASWLAGGSMVVLIVLVLAFFPWSHRPTWLGGWKCFRHGFVFALPAAFLTIIMLRRGAAMAYGPVGAAAGLLAGLAGMATLHVGCTLYGAWHILSQHLLVPLTSAAAGFLVGKTLERALRRRV